MNFFRLVKLFKRISVNLWKDFIERHMFRQSSIYRHMALDAHKTSIEFAVNNLAMARRFSSRKEILEYCIQQSPKEGLITEFGVYKGDSLKLLCRLEQNRAIYGFDSFEGLPEDWGAVMSKDFFALTSLPKVPDNAELVHGWFNKTIPVFLEAQPDSVAFVHIDCDLFSSTKDVLEGIKDRLQIGCVILFDELINVVGWEQNEYRALYEFTVAYGIEFEYIAFHSEQALGAGTEVAIKITKV